MLELILGKNFFFDLKNWFRKAPNFGIDPELAVVTGTAIQAGVLAGGWPLQVSAIELPIAKQKNHIYNRDLNNQA